MVVFNYALNPPEFPAFEATRTSDGRCRQPDLRSLVVTFDMDVRRFVTVGRVEEEAVRTGLENGGQSRLLERGVRSNLDEAAGRWDGRWGLG
jgi:hypothetical protein